MRALIGFFRNTTPDPSRFQVVVSPPNTLGPHDRELLIYREMGMMMQAGYTRFFIPNIDLLIPMVKTEPVLVAMARMETELGLDIAFSTATHNWLWHPDLTIQYEGVQSHMTPNSIYFMRMIYGNLLDAYDTGVFTEETLVQDGRYEPTRHSSIFVHPPTTKKPCPTDPSTATPSTTTTSATPPVSSKRSATKRGRHLDTQTLGQ